MAPPLSRQHISTLAILEQQILEWKKASVSRKPKPLSIPPRTPAQRRVRKHGKRAKSLKDATTLLKSTIKVRTTGDCKRLQGKKLKTKKSSKRSIRQKGKSNTALQSSNVTDREQVFPQLLIQDSSEFTVRSYSAMLQEGYLPIKVPEKRQLQQNDWLPSHPTITKEMRREQIELIMNLTGKFIFGDGLGYHAVCILDNFMSKTPQRVVNSDNFKLVATAAFVTALNSRFGKETNEIIDALSKVGATEIQQIRRFTQFIKSTLGLDEIMASNALDFLSALYNNQTSGTVNPKIDQVCIQSQRLLMAATKSYTVMTQTYPSRLAASAILVSCELLHENCCQLFPNFEIPTSINAIKTINITMNWFRQVHRNMTSTSITVPKQCC